MSFLPRKCLLITLVTITKANSPHLLILLFGAQHNMLERKKGTGGFGFNSNEETNTILSSGHFNPYEGGYSRENSVFDGEPYITKPRRKDDLHEEGSNDLILSGTNIVNPPQGGWQVGDWGKVSRKEIY